jgi:hypothetical protein
MSYFSRKILDKNELPTTNHQRKQKNADLISAPSNKVSEQT